MVSFGGKALTSNWYSGNLRFEEAISGKGEFQIGKWISATVGSGQIISSTKTKALDVCVDDGGVALTSSTQAVRSRVLVATAIASGDVSVQGLLGHVKAVANIASTGWVSGMRGYFEASSASVSSCAGVRGMVDIPSGSTIASGAVAAGLQADSNDLGGTHTGKAAAIHVPNPVAGTWDFGMIFGDATGCFQANTTRGSDTYSLLIRIGTTTYKIPVYAAS